MDNLYYVIGAGAVAMLFAFWKASWINNQDEGTDRIFFGQNNQIRQIFFNGLTASKIYMRKVRPNLGPQFDSISHAILPSTSPAHASMTLDEKSEKWATIGDHL